MLKKWHEVYSNNEEQRFFIGADGASGLVRSAKWNFRSVASLAKEGKLTKEQVERIIDKFLKMGIVVASPDQEDHYGYWQRVAPHLNNQVGGSIAQTDHNSRVKASKSP
jgi:hypothetical protein